jgi:HEAT repeat protein
VDIALPILKKAAMVGAPNTRYSAIWAIGELAGDKPIEVLADLLRTGDRNTAPPAAQALANAGGPLAREALIEVALSDRGEWSGALAQLQMMQGDDVDQALLEVVKNGTSQERRLALPRLLKAGNKLAIALAIDMASSGSRNERTDAMRMLADSAQPAAIDALIAIADAGRGQTRMTALEMLIQNRPSDPALTKMLTDSLLSGRVEEAGYAAQLLGRMGTPDAKNALIAALNGRDPMLTMAAINAIGQNGIGEKEKAALLNVARSGDAKVRALAAQQLLQSGASEGVQLAADLINGSDKNMAQQAVWSLATVQSPEAIRVLEQALNSRDPQVRAAAVSALGQHGDVAMADKLTNLARDSDPQVRAAALQSLGQIGGDKANQALIDATKNGKPEDRVTAVQSLASKDDDRTSKVLADLIRDRDPQVALAAVNSSYNGGDEVDQSLIALMNAPSTSQDLRTSAANQLRSRGTDLDEKTEKAVKDIAGPPQMYGGYGYGGYGGGEYNQGYEGE